MQQLPWRHLPALLWQQLVLLVQCWHLFHGGCHRLLLLPSGAHQRQRQLVLHHSELPQRLVLLGRQLLLLLRRPVPLWHHLLLLQRWDVQQRLLLYQLRQLPQRQVCEQLGLHQLHLLSLWPDLPQRRLLLHPHHLPRGPVPLWQHLLLLQRWLLLWRGVQHLVQRLPSGPVEHWRQRALQRVRGGELQQPQRQQLLRSVWPWDLQQQRRQQLQLLQRWQHQRQGGLWL